MTHCKYNMWVDCDNAAHCSKCGFSNPVHAERVARIRELMSAYSPPTPEKAEINKAYASGRRAGRSEAFLEMFYILVSRYDYDYYALQSIRSLLSILRHDISAGRVTHTDLEDRLRAYGYFVTEDCE